MLSLFTALKQTEIKEKKNTPTANDMALTCTTDTPMSFSTKASEMLPQSAMKCL